MVAEMDDEALARRHAREGAEDAEVARLRGLTPEKRAVVLRRLRAIDLYLASDRTRREAAAAAEKLGLGVSSFYNLKRLLEVHGPVGGLAPYNRRKIRFAVEREGLLQAAETSLAARMATDPDTPTADLERLVAQAFADAGLPSPSPDTVRRRIRALRVTRRARHMRIGEEVRLIQWDVEGGLAFGRAFSEVVTFLIDEGTGLVVALGLAADGPSSLAAAIEDAADRIGALGAAGMPFAASPGRLTLTDATRPLVASSGGSGAFEDIGRATDDGTPFIRALAAFAAEKEPDLTPSKTLDGLARRIPALVDEWNERILGSRRRRSRRNLDDGSGLRRALRRLTADGRQEAVRGIVG